MTPDMILLIGQLLLRYGPTIAREFQILFTLKEVTQADWDTLWAKAHEAWVDMQPPAAVAP